MIELRIHGVRRLIVDAVEPTVSMNLNGAPRTEAPVFPAIRVSWRDFDPLWLHVDGSPRRPHLTVVK